MEHGGGFKGVLGWKYVAVRAYAPRADRDPQGGGGMFRLLEGRSFRRWRL